MPRTAQRTHLRRGGRLCGLVLALSQAGCRYGAEGDPLRLVEPPSDGGVDAGSAPSADGEDPGAASGPGKPAEVVAPGTPAARADASVPGPAVGFPADAGVYDPGEVVVDVCSPVVADCDPVKKTGCVDFISMECVVDRDATEPKGRCVFFDAMPVDGGGCAEDIVRTTCAPGHGCYAGACQKLCTCDDQCEAGSCCVEPASPRAGNVIKYCGACP
jgi:hypothetical protein